MVTFFFTAFVLLAFLLVAAYFRQKSSTQPKIEGLENFRSNLPRPESSRLFGETLAEEIPKEISPHDAAAQRGLLLARASAGDNTAAAAALKNFDRTLYGEILNGLVIQADSDAKLLSLLSYIIGNEMPVTKELAQATIKEWASSPDRGSTSRTLHITALADDAQLYQSTVEAALNLWRRRLLTNVSAAELRALIDGEFWVLSTPTRNSGAGFMLKRALAKARRELESAMNVN
ncbi:MAG: hypothetical protein M3R68_06725 [Acidobacteriota bacterium]|nr:hypothetical protein [Acidobacteriota bacterium]